MLNPHSALRFHSSVQHSLLNGFGRALNARNMTIAKANIGINDFTFKTQVIAVVVSVLNATTQWFPIIKISSETAGSFRGSAVL